MPNLEAGNINMLAKELTNGRQEVGSTICSASPKPPTTPPGVLPC
jgi:hypothetical protein